VAWQPCLAFAAALSALCLAASLDGESPFATATWSHWDAAHYQAIAAHGYDLHRCAPGESTARDRWCGNTAWFPGYPLLIAAVHLAGVPLRVAAVAVAWTCALVALLVLWAGFLRETPIVGLVYAAAAPGIVYLFAAFPLSLFVALTAAFLALLRRNNWLLAAAAAFAAALTYPIGVMSLPLVGAVYGLAAHRRGVAALLTAAPPAAFGLIVVVQRWQTGRWTAFFDVQAHYGHGIHNPLGVTWNALLLVTRAAGFHYEPYPIGAWQSLFVAAVLVAVLASVAWHRSRTELLLAGLAAYGVGAAIDPGERVGLAERGRARADGAPRGAAAGAARVDDGRHRSSPRDCARRPLRPRDGDLGTLHI
jgi:hypothetical protein